MTEWIGHMLSIESYELAYYAAALIKLAIALGIVLLLRRFFRGRAKELLYLAFIVYLIRLLFFMSPYGFTLYVKAAKSELTGFEEGITIYERDLYKKPYKAYFSSTGGAMVDVLAVGTSQTVALYKQRYFLNRSGYEENVIFNLFGLPGFQPVDLMLYFEHIKRFRPSTVLLYESALDLNYLMFERMPMAPRQGLYLAGFVSGFLKHGYISEAGEELKSLAIGELLPEYKYSYIYKAMTRRLFGHKSSVSAFSDKEEAIPSFKIPELDIKRLDFNLSYVEEFLALCRGEGIEVIILEGTYNPVARSEDHEYATGLIRQRLESLAARYKNTRFIPASALYRFSDSEWKDATHATEMAAYRFRTQLFNEHIIPYLKERKANANR